MPEPAARRRELLARAALLSLALPAGMAARPAAAQRPSDADRAEWVAFQSRFIAPDGRVVDTGNAGISHSEGQGWALLLATRMDDPASFGRILGWTRAALRRPQDHLHAWRFRPQAARPVDDLNNATDGDLCIAWALLEAGERWGHGDLTALGTAIGQDILRLLVQPAGRFSVLLPGAQHFDRPESTVLNPSYYVFPALMVLARAVPDPAWVRVAADGLRLLRAGRFGRWGLPPDWMLLHKAMGGLSLPSRWPKRFSYDAVRVPLYLAWAGMAREPALLQAHAFWTDPGHAFLPAWADLASDGLAPYAASAGTMAVAQLVSALGARPAAAATGRVASAPFRGIGHDTDYYAAALVMLSRLAWRDIIASAG